MKIASKLLYLPIIFLLACGGGQVNQTINPDDSLEEYAVTTNNETSNAQSQDTTGNSDNSYAYNSLNNDSSDSSYPAGTTPKQTSSLEDITAGNVAAEANPWDKLMQTIKGTTANGTNLNNSDEWEILDGQPKVKFSAGILSFSTTSQNYEGFIEIEVKSDIYKYNEEINGIGLKPIKIGTSNIGKLNFKKDDYSNQGKLEKSDEIVRNVEIVGVNIDNVVGDKIYRKVEEFCFSWKTAFQTGPFGIIKDYRSEIDKKCFNIRDDSDLENKGDLNKDEILLQSQEGDLTLFISREVTDLW